MKTYEEIYDLLLDAGEGVDLQVASVEHYIETVSLDKEFIFVCVPPGERPSHKVRAEISFVWDATLTAASIYGLRPSSHAGGHGQGASPEMLSPEMLSFGDLPLATDDEPYFELYIKYLFEVPTAERVAELSDRLRRILHTVIDHDNFPEMKFEVSVLPDNKVVVDDAYAFYWWQISLAEGAELDFTGVMTEVKRVLEVLLTSELGG